MRVLITWGSKMGGTEGIARMLGEGLGAEGVDVTLSPAPSAPQLSPYDAVIVGGALYANRWHVGARRFVNRHLDELRQKSVWLFSSGPLDDSADHGELAPPTQVAVLAERLGALGHRTFGGRLAPNAKGFPASSMAHTMSGDFRNPEQIRAWAHELAEALPSARPGPWHEPRARSPLRRLGYALLGAALVSAATLTLLTLLSPATALTLSALCTALVFTPLSAAYFRARGSCDPAPTALAFAALCLVVNLVVAGLFFPPLGAITIALALLLPALFTFAASAITGFLISTMPWTDTTSNAAALRAADRG